MCELRRKLLAFDYTIGELVKWDSEVNGHTEKESLQMFSNVRLMKCLYSICAVSVAFYEESNVSLFDLFDNFLAYPRGPVEVDTYINLSSLIRYKMYHDSQKNDSYLVPNEDFQDEFLITYGKLNRTHFEKDKTAALMEIIEHEKQLCVMIPLINKAINLLKQATKFPNFNDIDSLVEITHLDLWKEACARKDKKLETDNVLKIKHELELFKERIGLVA